MKVRVFHAYDDNRHGTASIVAATEDAINDYFWKDAFEHSHHHEAETLEELKSYFEGDVSEAMADCCPDTCWGIDTEILDITPIVPKDQIQAARAAVEALVYARNCLKAAGAKRTTTLRVLGALSSAKGAVRNTEMQARRRETIDGVCTERTEERSQ